MWRSLVFVSLVGAVVGGSLSAAGVLPTLFHQPHSATVDIVDEDDHRSSSSSSSSPPPLGPVVTVDKPLPTMFPVEHRQRPRPHLYLKVPQPYVIGSGTSARGLRLAMVNDVLHQRYPIHGGAWFRARVDYLLPQVEPLLLRAEGGGGDGVSTDELQLLDDLAVAYLRLHRDAEAEGLMQVKLALMEVHQIDLEPTIPDLDVERFLRDTAYRSLQAAVADRLRPATDGAPSHRYTALANLGTAIIHQAVAPALAGDQAAAARLREGAAHVRAAIAHHPGGHGHREVWQMRAVGHIAENIEQPALWTQRDFMGNPLLSKPIPMAQHLEKVEALKPWDRPSAARPSWFAKVPREEHSHAVHMVRDPEQPWRIAAVEAVRSHIMPLAFTAELSSPPPAEVELVPFDEPLLGVMGMWMMGGGPNPHSALTIAGIMERIGQRRLAWRGYARALSMQERFHKDPAIREKLAAYCRARQAVLAREMEVNGKELQQQFEDELAFGQQWQESLANYEEQLLLDGSGDPADQPTIAMFIEEHGGVASRGSDADLLLLPFTNHRRARPLSDRQIERLTLKPPPLDATMISAEDKDVVDSAPVKPAATKETAATSEQEIAATEAESGSPESSPADGAPLQTTSITVSTTVVDAGFPNLLNLLPGIAIGMAGASLLLLLVVPSPARARRHGHRARQPDQRPPS